MLFTVNGLVEPFDPFGGLEGDPASDTLWSLSGSASATFTSISVLNEDARVIEDEYGELSIFEAIARTDSGVIYLAHRPEGFSAEPSLSRVNPVSGELSGTVRTTLELAPTRIVALAAVGETLYAFSSPGRDKLFSVDPATGFLTLVRENSEEFTDIVAAADSTSSGRIYFISLDGNMDSTLHFLEVSGGTTTTVGRVTGMELVLAENLAIATLLSSERGSPGEATPGRDDEKDDDEQMVTPVLMSPSLAATGAELDWLLVVGVIVAVLGVFLIIVAAAARQSRSAPRALEANEGQRGATQR